MEKANVAIFDDLEIFRTRTELLLKNLGHNILVNSPTLSESLEAIEKLQESLDVALVDGDLGTSYERMTEDGERIALALKAKFGETVKIVSVSSAGLFDGSDAAFAKNDIESIANFIESIPEKD